MFLASSFGTFMWSQFHGEHVSAVRRRRKRRLRQFLRHERLSVAMALAEFTPHNSRGQRARAGGVEHEVNYEPRLQNPPLPPAARVQHFFLDDDEPPVAGSRPDRLSAESVPQERVQRHTVEQMVVPVLVAPVPLLGSCCEVGCALGRWEPLPPPVRVRPCRELAAGLHSVGGGQATLGGASSCGVVSRSRVRRSSPWRGFCLTSEEGPPPDQAVNKFWSACWGGCCATDPGADRGGGGSCA